MSIAASFACAVASVSAAAAVVEDVRAGRAGGVARLEIVLSGAVEPQALEGGAFLLPGIDGPALQLEAPASAAPLSRIQLAPAAGGLRVDMGGLAASGWRAEQTGGRVRLLIDVDASDVATPRAAAAAPGVTAPTPASLPKTPTPRPPQMPVPQPSKPADAAPAPLIPVVTPLEEGEAPQSEAAPSADIRAAATDVTGVPLDEGACQDAKDKVTADAWDMDALVDYGLCLAADGVTDEADTVFRRLLSFDPMSYKAHLGRGLIAANKGDAAAADSHYQAALNSQPPEEAAEKIRGLMSPPA